MFDMGTLQIWYLTQFRYTKDLVPLSIWVHVRHGYIKDWYLSQFGYMFDMVTLKIWFPN